MPQYNQSTIDNSNRLDPTFGLGNLSKAADNTIESRRRQAAQINAVRRTLSLKGIAPKGTIEVGESGVPEFDNAADKDAYYKIAKNNRSTPGTGTTVTSELMPNNREEVLARGAEVMQTSGENAATVIAGQKPVSQMNLAPSNAKATLPQNQGTVSATPTTLVTPREAAASAALLKNKVLAPQAQQTLQPSSMHSGQSISNSANFGASIGAPSYNESNTNLQRVNTNVDIGVNDDVQMDLADLMAADVNEGAVATVSGGAKNQTFEKAITQYGAVSQGIQNALGKKANISEIKDAGTTSMQFQGTSGSRQEGVSSSSSVNSTTNNGGPKQKSDTLSLTGADGGKLDYETDRATGKTKIPFGSKLAITSTDFVGGLASAVASDKGKSLQDHMIRMLQQHAESGSPGEYKYEKNKEGTVEMKSKTGESIGKYILDSTVNYFKANDGQIYIAKSPSAKGDQRLNTPVVHFQATKGTKGGVNTWDKLDMTSAFYQDGEH